MSSKRLAVEVDNLSKRYVLSHQEKHRYMGQALVSKLKNPFAKPQTEEFWALKNVSFNVEEGEVLGIVGGNGAGKSTMLKILSQIAEPTSGEVRMHGKVGALLEVGTGFHPELTGRENIFLNGTILGMRRREVMKRFDEIVDFAEVERFIDTPVKRYSSGMYVRLAFAVAANLNPEILIVDEVLAVGDAKFQAKCLGKMREVAKGEGRTVLFVSHNAAAVRDLCTKAVLLKQGQLAYYGETEEVLKLHADVPVSTGRILDGAQVVNEGLVIDRITVNGSESSDVDLGANENVLDIVISGMATKPLTARFGVYLSDKSGYTLAHFGEEILSRTPPQVEAGPFVWRAKIELPRTLNEGTYYMTVDLSEHNVQAWVLFDRAIKITKAGGKDGTGLPMLSDVYGLMMLDGTVSRQSAVPERTP